MSSPNTSSGEEKRQQHPGKLKVARDPSKLSKKSVRQAKREEEQLRQAGQ